MYILFCFNILLSLNLKISILIFLVFWRITNHVMRLENPLPTDVLFVLLSTVLKVDLCTEQCTNDVVMQKWLTPPIAAAWESIEEGKLPFGTIPHRYNVIKTIWCNWAFRFFRSMICLITGVIGINKTNDRIRVRLIMGSCSLRTRAHNYFMWCSTVKYGGSEEKR